MKITKAYLDSMIVLIKILLLVAGLSIFFRWFERQSVWVPRRVYDRSPLEVGLDFEEIFFTAGDEVRLCGWYIPANQPRANLLFCHGNGGNISHRIESIQQFHSLELNVFIFDYRGYGKSGGWLTEAGTYRDADAAYQVLESKAPGLPVLLFGRSLGASIAAHLAASKPAHGLIAESAFTSIRDIGQEIFPFLPVRWITTIRYDTLEKMTRVAIPVLFVHSRQDEIVPFHHSERLFESAKEPKFFLEIQGSHNDGFLVSESLYLDRMNRFIEFCLQPLQTMNAG